MKLRTCRFSLLFALVFAICGFAQGEHGDTTGSHGKDGAPRGRGKGREHKQQTACVMGCLSLTHSRVIPTHDGGVVVVIGDKLIKFDRNMRPKQEVVIEMSREEVQRSVQRMKDIMDICKEMMPGGPGVERSMYDGCCDDDTYKE